MIIKGNPSEFVVMGVDPNSYTGIVVLKGGNLVASRAINFPGKVGYERLHLLGTAFSSVLDQFNPNAVVIEGFAYGNKFTLATVVAIGSNFRRILYEKRVPWWDVQPTSLKKYTTGSGKAKKPDMAASVESRWGFKSDSDDVVDAYALAQLGWAVATGSTKLKLTSGDTRP